MSTLTSLEPEIKLPIIDQKNFSSLCQTDNLSFHFRLSLLVNQKGDNFRSCPFFILIAYHSTMKNPFIQCRRPVSNTREEKQVQNFSDQHSQKIGLGMQVLIWSEFQELSWYTHLPILTQCSQYLLVSLPIVSKTRIQIRLRTCPVILNKEFQASNTDEKNQDMSMAQKHEIIII